MAPAPQTWILTGSPENVAATREDGFRPVGLKAEAVRDEREHVTAR